MTYFACGRTSHTPEPDIAIGDTVARKSQRSITGEVVSIFRATSGKLTAKVKWPDTTRIGGKGFKHSSVALSSLVKIEDEGASK
jgi:hypothetical protein